VPLAAAGNAVVLHLAQTGAGPPPGGPDEGGVGDDLDEEVAPAADEAERARHEPGDRVDDGTGGEAGDD